MQDRRYSPGDDDYARWHAFEPILDAITEAFDVEGLLPQHRAVVAELYARVSPIVGQRVLRVPTDWSPDSPAAAPWSKEKARHESGASHTPPAAWGASWAARPRPAAIEGHRIPHRPPAGLHARGVRRPLRPALRTAPTVE